MNPTATVAAGRTDTVPRELIKTTTRPMSMPLVTEIMGTERVWAKIYK